MIPYYDDFEELEEVKIKKKESIKFPIEDKTKLKFLNFVNYFNKVMTEFPEVSIHGMENKSGELTLVGTMEKIKDVKIKIFEDLTKISETVVKLSDRQINFLQKTDCQIVNDEFKNDDVMLVLTRKEGFVGSKRLQANIMTLKKRDDKEVMNILKWHESVYSLHYRFIVEIFYFLLSNQLDIIIKKYGQHKS